MSQRFSWVAGMLLATGLGFGCRTGRPDRDWEDEERSDRRVLEERLELDGTTLTIRGQGVDPRGFEQVLRAVEKADRPLERWGELHDPVTITVLPNDRALDAEVSEGRFAGRRGFARYDEIFVLAPEVWGRRGARSAELEELVLHELTHTLMYQLASNRTGWRRKGIPFWFREGMASYTARQAYRWREPSRDELEDPDVRGRYGLAHYAFDTLLSRGGERRVKAVLDEMQEGSSFEEAFEEVYRKPEPEFIAELERTLPDPR